MKRALVSGISGQDGSYLADLLLSKGYKVFGGYRRVSSPNFTNIAHILDNPNFQLVPLDLTDQGSVNRAVVGSLPDEVYNLAAQSFVGASWQYPITTMDITGLGAFRMLEALRQFNPKARFYQASSSEMFGNTGGFLNEKDRFAPRSPYGVAKVAAHYGAINYRESFGMFVACGILFNHESERRGLEFVTRKITDGVARIKLGLQDKLVLGNLDTYRDWGYAPDYVEGMWLMLQQDKPDDYILATGETRSIRDFCQAAFGAVDINGWQDFVESDPQFRRPAELNTLTGDASKARTKLGWKPKITFGQMVKLMVANDLRRNT